MPAADAAQVREACARWRLRFAVDATPYPRPDAECSPGRGHVHHDARRCDSTRKTIPGWEYQFTAAPGHLRTAWAILVDVERTTPATRTRQTARQVQNLLRRPHAAGHGGRGAPLVIMDAGYSAAALAGQPVHLLIRLASGQASYADPVTLPASAVAPASTAWRSPAATTPARPTPNPMSPLTLPGTPRYGTVRVSAWRRVHPPLHGDRGYFAGWRGELPTQAAMGKETAVRSQMDVRICLRVREKRDADLILGQGSVNSGWHAHQLTQPGEFLISDPEHTAPERNRAYLLTDERIARHAAQYATTRPRLPADGPDTPQNAPGSPQNGEHPSSVR